MTHYRHLSNSERISIRAMSNRGISIRRIASALQRAPSTVSRELVRNRFPCGEYNPHVAHRWALFRRQERPRKIRGHLEIQILRLLDQSFSPEQIQMLLWSRQRTKISHQTIYSYIWEDWDHGGKLWKTLRYCGKGRHCRRYRYGPGTTRRVRRSIRCIESRADHIGRRLRYGHWEMDLIEGVGRKRPLLVLLERKSRFVTAGFLKGKWSEEVVRVGTRLLRNLKVLTITTDSGPEFMNYRLIEERFKCPLYSESIHGTTASPFDFDFPWGCMTQKGDTLYLHVMKWNANGIRFDGVIGKPSKAYLLADPERKVLTIKQDAAENSITVNVPEDAPDANDYPREHWRSIRTNNPLERLMREIRRRTRVVGAFPDGDSAVMLAGARLRHVSGTKWGLRRYLDMNHLRTNERGSRAVAAS